MEKCELEKKWQEVFMAQFEVRSRRLSGVYEENCRSKQPFCVPSFELGTFQIRKRSANYSALRVHVITFYICSS
jgi:hypothetical protein